MKAILHTQYGPPEALRFQEVELPAPQENQVLVRVHAASVNAREWRGFAMSPLLSRLLAAFFRKPKDPRLGADLAGTVQAVGDNVTEFQPGDEVFGVCAGSFAEYAVAGKSKLALKPTHVSFKAAAAVPVAAFTALQGLRDKGKIQAGQSVLIDGASGGVGLFAVQIAKAFGAEVTAVCSTRNLELVRSVGADHAIDYTREDFTRNRQRYDLIYAVNGSHSMFAYRRALNPAGICVVAGGPISQIFLSMFLGPLLSKFGKKKIGFQGIATTPQQDLHFIRELLETNKLVVVIDKCYGLAQVPQAIRYLMDEHARGKVIVELSNLTN